MENTNKKNHRKRRRERTVRAPAYTESTAAQYVALESVNRVNIETDQKISAKTANRQRRFPSGRIHLHEPSGSAPTVFGALNRHDRRSLPPGERRRVIECVVNASATRRRKTPSLSLVRKRKNKTASAWRENNPQCSAANSFGRLSNVELSNK